MVVTVNGLKHVTQSDCNGNLILKENRIRKSVVKKYIGSNST